jgi:glycosyltransferase involved in cell wall biosynthesis
VLRARTIFWWHPGLVRPRARLFSILSERYFISFLFLDPSTISHLQRVITDHPLAQTSDYCSERGVITKRLLLYWISPQDIRKIYAGIGQADLFVSSFVWNAYTIVGLVICKLLKKKIIVWDETNVIRSGLISSAKYAIIRFLCKHVDAFFVMGKVPENALKWFGVHTEKILVAKENPAHIFSELKPKEAPRIPIDERDRVVLFIGRLIEFKGVEYLIKAFRSVEQELDGVHLLIAGVGPLRTSLEASATAIGLKNCTFLGNVSDDEKTYLFAKSNMVVVPSIITRSAAEGGNGPVVILEALSAGKPVITTTAAGSNANFVRNGINGFVVPEKDARALAEKIRYLLTNPIPPSQVLASFRQIKGTDSQVDQFEKAINYVMRSR